MEEIMEKRIYEVFLRVGDELAFEYNIDRNAMEGIMEKLIYLFVTRI